MSDEAKTLYGMKASIMVVVHVKGLPNACIVKLPFRPHRGDWINLEGQALQWDDLDEVPKIIPEVANAAGLAACSSIQVEDVDIFCDVERDECVIHVFGLMDVDPLRGNNRGRVRI